MNCDKVTSVLLQHGEWYEGDPGTFTSIPEAKVLSGHPRTNAFAWKSHGQSRVSLQRARPRPLFQVKRDTPEAFSLS